MRIDVCPATTVNARLDTVWGLLTDWPSFASWSGVELVGVDPPGPAAAGQHVALRAGAFGRSWAVTVDVLEVDAPARLAIDVRTPLGVVNHELVTLADTRRGTLVRFN
jgi:Polyketide cyclase / dehydrase and lipid transport